MHIGHFLLIAALFTTAVSIAAYIYSTIVKNRYVNLGRSAYLAATALVIGISAFFMWLILDNHFEVQYIAMNSSTDLPLYYKISVFWAGQQGSFLFWAFVSGIVGLFVMRRAREFEPGLMAFWGTVQSLLIVLLLIDSPFMLLPEETRMQVMDGIGLRELLQNPWMVVHPPVTFLGYTAMCVPAAFAIAALLKGDFSKWAKATLPWAVFGWLTLGAGIILGAYWSYGVLGWGGYWAWDPVENASLVPWLTGTALLHGLIAERYRGSFQRANIVLALLTFLFVFYSTFLTRSSVLADASVHTFGDSKAGVPLLVFMSVFLAFSAISLIAGWRKMASIPSYTVMKSKDFMFFLGVIALVGSAAFVLIGTSAPIIGKALPASVVERISPAPQIEQMAQTADGETEKKPTIQVDQSFYNKTNAPVAAIAVLLMALAPVAAWRREKTEKAEIIPALLVGIGIAAVGFVAFKLHITYIALVLGLVSIPALLLNLYSLVRMRKSGIRALGGFITHIGMAVFFLGVVLSANQSKTIPVNLPEGEPQTVELSSFGKPIAMREYKFTYEGTEPINERKTALKIKVEHDGKVDHAVVSMPSKPEYQREVPGVPYIISSFTKDLYIAPKFLPTTIEGLVDKGEPVPISDFKLTFTDFVLPEDFNSSNIVVGATLLIESDGKKQSVTPELVTRRTADTKTAVDVPGMPAKISIDRISVEEKTIYVTFTPTDDEPQMLSLPRDEEVTAGKYALTFKEWFFPSGSHGSGVGAKIEVTSDTKTATVSPIFEPGNAPKIETESKPVIIPGTGTEVALLGVDIENEQAALSITPTSAVIDVSVKPFISLLWIGSVLALIGGCIAVWRRMAESSESDEKPKTKKVSPRKPVHT